MVSSFSFRSVFFFELRGRFITANLLPTDERAPDQLTTPIDLIVTPEETVMVVDPRHPLFGRTLPYVGISNSSHRGRCCIVWIGPTIERHIPVSATNLEFDPTTLSPLAISVESLRQLVYEFTCMTHASKGEQADGNSATSFSHALCEHGSSPSDPAPSGLENASTSTTSDGSSDPRHHVSAVSASRKGGHR